MGAEQLCHHSRSIPTNLYEAKTWQCKEANRTEVSLTNILIEKVVVVVIVHIIVTLRLDVGPIAATQ